MKKVKVVLLFVLSFLSLYSQDEKEDVVSNTIRTKQNKYFVSVGYGTGTARWYSKIIDSELYDKNGTVIKSGNLDFRAKNSINLSNFEVSCPVSKVRIGLGISFESFFLDKIVYKNSSKNNENYIVFDESFRFDKFYAIVEIPFARDSEKKYSLNFKGNLGYFNYTGIERFNFFGENPLAKMYLINAGLIADYKIFSHTYAYIYPNIEFKYFKNNHKESPSDINHNILSYLILGGLRVDVSRE